MRILALVFIFLTSSLALASDYIWINKSGAFTISTEWTKNEFGSDALSGKLSFKPADSVCKSAGFVQIARMTDNQGKDLDFKKGSGLEPRNEIKTKEKFFVDYVPTKCEKGKDCSPYYIDSWPTDGSFSDAKTSASMADYPFGWEEFSTIELEACAVCKDNKQILGCVSWGGKFPVVGDKTLIKPIMNIKSSPQFEEALQNFKQYYR